jgi:putative FmdB family regulatory protein
MPLYEYKCESCGKTFEVIQKFADEPLNVHPECGGKVERLISAPAFHLKGTGWYATDYAKSNGSDLKSKENRENKDSKSDESKSAKSGDSESKADSTKKSESSSSASDSKPAAASSNTKADTKPAGPSSNPA